MTPPSQCPDVLQHWQEFSHCFGLAQAKKLVQIDTVRRATLEFRNTFKKYAKLIDMLINIIYFQKTKWIEKNFKKINSCQYKIWYTRKLTIYLYILYAKGITLDKGLKDNVIKKLKDLRIKI